MIHLSPFMMSNFCPHRMLSITTTETHIQSPWIYMQGSFFLHHRNKCSPVSSLHSSVVSLEREAEETIENEELKVKWHDVGPDITEAQMYAISQLPPKMTNRCKALMKRIICFSSQDENLSLLLAAWVKVMKPRRCDWLSILKELKSIENPLLVEVMEYALTDDSFEANVRDYTKLIDTCAKHNHIQRAETAFEAMKNQGFPCDQVTLTVLVHMYSKAGDLNRAKEAFEEIQLLGLPLDKRAYGSMIMAYVRAGMLDLAESLMGEMEAKEIHAGREVYKALLRAYSIAGDANGAQRVFDAIQFAGIVPDCKLCALLVNAYCVASLSDKARSVLENMKSVGLKPSEKCIALVLGAYEKENSLEKALGFLMDLETDGIAVGEEASGILEQWCSRLGVVDEVEPSLRILSSRNTQRLKLLQSSRASDDCV